MRTQGPISGFNFITSNLITDLTHPISSIGTTFFQVFFNFVNNHLLPNSSTLSTYNNVVISPSPTTSVM